MNALYLTEQLISRRSVTPEDGGCQQLLRERLEPLGFACETITSGPDTFRVTNLWAKHPARAPVARTVVFAGHTDVVPTGPLEQWTSDPFVPAHRDGKLYGRGAADMKTSIAAFTVAAGEFLAANPNPAISIALLITSDEEGPSVDGTKVVCEKLQARGDRLDWCIVGEPSSVERLGDMIKNGRRGSLSGKLAVRGEQAHIAYPQLGKNPIHHALPALAELAAREWDRGNAYFPATSFQVSNIHGGTGANNIIPGSVVIDFNFRFSTEWTPERLQAEVETTLKRHALDYQLAWSLSGLPFLTTPGELVGAIQQAIRAETGVETELSTTGGTSDGRFISRICPQVVEFGPVNATIHKIDEHVAVADIEPLKNIYRRTLELLEAQASPMTLAELVEAGAARLDAAGVAFGHGTANAFDEAAWLVLWQLGLALDTDLSPDSPDAVREVPPAQIAAAQALIERRIATREPAAYLTGEAWLQGVRFRVDRRTIVPRSFIAELVADGGIDPWLGEDTLHVLDLCTGNGSLAVLAAMAWPDVQVDAADISRDALDVARINVDEHGLADRIRLVESDGLAALPGPYDLVLCNPPYVNAASMAQLPAEYRAEPELALAGGADGMDFIRRLLAGLPSRLAPHGVLVLEIGNERENFERAFPRLEAVWLETSAGADQVLLLTREDLLQP